MRPPIKVMETYGKLKAAIEDGTYVSGTFLPNEVELSLSLGISRNTLRPALERLMEDGLIERIRSKGTLVCDRHNARQPLTFLLPCADFLSDTEHYENAEFMRRVFNGFVQMAFEYDRRVEVLPVSPTNNDNDIDWSKLKYLNCNSMVFVSGFWFHSILPVLQETKCRVVFLDCQDADRKFYQHLVSGWDEIVALRDEQMAMAVRLLAERGNRKIAFLHRYLNEENNSALRGYYSGLRSCKLNYAVWNNLTPEPLPGREAATMIAEFHRKNNFDALLLDAGLIRRVQFTGSVNRCLGLPDNVDILVTKEQERNQHLYPALSSCDFPAEEIGRLGARKLLQHEVVIPEIHGMVIERESTGRKELCYVH